MGGIRRRLKGRKAERRPGAKAVVLPTKRWKYRPVGLASDPPPHTPMAASGSLRSGLLIAVSTALLGLATTASAGSGANVAGASTTPTLGEPLGASTAEQKALSAHLRSKGALFYGAWWCPACFQQKNLFGKEAGNSLPYVECDKTDDGRAVCTAAKIRAFPTWELAGKQRLEGVQTIDELKVWSGFQSGTNQSPSDHSQH
jgi:hypothetical protein